MKNKKIISLICALAMVFSMFSAFTVANAENTKGIALDSSISKDNKTITITATAVGVADNKVNSYQISVNIPDGVKLDDIKYTSEKDPTTTGIDNGIYTAVFFDVAGVAFKDNKIATIEITLPTALADDYVVTLQDESTIGDANGEVKVGKGTMDASTVTVVPSGQKPPKADRPVENTDADPVEPDKPTPVEPTGKGIALKASLDKTGKVVTITATAVGVADNKVNSYQISINIPDGVKLDDIKYTSEKDPTTTGIDNGIYTAVFFDVAGVAFKDNKIATIEMTLPTAITAPTAFTLQGESTIGDANGEVKVGKGTMTASSAVAEPAGSSQPTGKTVALKDYVAKEGPAAAAAAKEAGKTVYMTVDVTDKDGNAAAYGTDYVAEYPAGTKLTKKAYENLIHGYTANTDMADVISNLKFVVYNSTNANKIKTTLNTVEDKKQLVDPTEKVIGGKEPTPTKTPAKLTLTAKVEAKKLYVENATSINVDVKSGLHTVKNGDTVEYLIPANDKFIKFFTDADPSTKKVDGKDYKVITKTISNATEDEAPTATSTVNIKALSVTGTTKMLVNYYDGEIEKDEAPVAETSVSVKVQKKTDGGSGSSDDDDDDDDNTGSGPIAGWNGQTGNTALGQFTDLETVDWAKQAITMLAMKGIVSGDGNGLFRPNDNITRAEYCQILIGAINKTNEYADSSFADVPSDAWFYHAVAVASANGIVSGYGDGNFGPYDLITRQDMALMTYKAAQVMNKDMSAVRTMSFADGGAISDYAATAVQTLADAGIINGVSDTEFAPRANATRAQAAKILYDTFVK